MWKNGLVIATGLMAAGAMFAPAVATLEGVAHATPVVRMTEVSEPPRVQPDPAIPIPRHTLAPAYTEQTIENTSGISIDFLVFLGLLLLVFILFVLVAARHSGR